MAAPKGNQNAKKGAMWREALERALARSAPKGNRTVEKGLDPIADQVVSNALAGDKDSWQEIANRLDGKHAAAVTVSGDEDRPIITRIERVIVHDHDTD